MSSLFLPLQPIVSPSRVAEVTLLCSGPMQGRCENQKENKNVLLLVPPKTMPLAMSGGWLRGSRIGTHYSKIF